MDILTKIFLAHCAAKNVLISNVFVDWSMLKKGVNIEIIPEGANRLKGQSLKILATGNLGFSLHVTSFF